nr:MAG TPA: hypothetical protein [Caudoviricetes sp.]
MNIREVLKLKDGTEVKIVGTPSNDVWVVLNGETLRLKNEQVSIEEVSIEDKYILDFIVNADFERYYEPLTIGEVLCKERVGHIIKVVGEGPTVYHVIETNGKFDLEIVGSPMRIGDEYFLSTVLNSMYVDLKDCGEDIVDEE